VTPPGPPHIPWQRDWQFALAWAAAPLAWWVLGRAGLLGDTGVPGWYLAWLVLAAPLIEEAVFRGGVQPALGGRLAQMRAPAPRLLANLGTSLAFAALHLWAHSPAWAAAVMVPSLVFGHFRDRHGSLGTPVALHVGYNAVYFLGGAI
jgi:membrane protease YdiL (CAAX protease family)